MSPILTRPIREQLDHDRVIRLLQARYKRKHDVAINPGGERNEAVMAGELDVYPDLLLFSTSRGRALEGIVEVETVESVNQLEALAEWGTFGKVHVPFHLYVPPQALESARRMCDEHGFQVSEIWTYHMAIDQVRFTLAQRAQIVHPAPEPATVVAKAPATKVAVKAKAEAKAAPVAKGKVPAKPAPAPKKAVAKKATAKAAPKKVAAKPAKKAPVKNAPLAKKPAAAAARKPVAKKGR